MDEYEDGDMYMDDYGDEEGANMYIHILVLIPYLKNWVLFILILAPS